MAKTKLMYDFENDAKVGDIVRIIDRSRPGLEIVGFYQGLGEFKHTIFSQYNTPNQIDLEHSWGMSTSDHVWEYEILRRAKQGVK